mgnify:CR=1 FL=1
MSSRESYRSGLGSKGDKSSSKEGKSSSKSSGSKKSGYFVRGGVQTSNVDSKVHYEEVTDTHFKNIKEDKNKDENKDKDEAPDAKKR